MIQTDVPSAGVCNVLSLSGCRPFGDHIDKPLSCLGKIVVFKTADFENACLDRGRRFGNFREVPHNMAYSVFLEEIYPDFCFFKIIWIVAG